MQNVQDSKTSARVAESSSSIDSFVSVVSDYTIDVNKATDSKFQTFDKALKTRYSQVIHAEVKPKWGGFQKERFSEADNWYKRKMTGTRTGSDFSDLKEGSDDQAFYAGELLAAKDDNPRDQWAGKWDFSLSVLGYMVGFRNLSTFSSLVFNRGGVLFLIPHVIMFCILGYPLLLMEIALGQYTSRGPTACWNCSKLFKGLGYAMVFVSFLEGILYNRQIALILHYMVSSLSLPWKNYVSLHHHNGSFLSENASTFYKTEAYYNEVVLGKEPHDELFDNFTDLKQLLVLCVFAVWVFVLVSLVCGISTTGKIVKWTATLPYLFLIVFFFYAISLPGASKGVMFGMKPKPEMLGDFETWVKSAEFVFLSLGTGYGGHTMLASYNKFNAPVMTDTFIAACGDTVISLFATLVSFALFGFLAHTRGVSVDDLDINLTGQEIIFLVYPAILEQLEVGWSFFFFLTLVVLGIDSPLYNVETVITSVIDSFTLARRHRKYVVMGVALIMFLLSLPFCTVSGDELSKLYGKYTINLVFIGLCQCFAIGWVYGAERFVDEVEFMVGWDVTFLLSFDPCKKWWVICWKYLTPSLLSILFCYYVFVDRETTVQKAPGWTRFVLHFNQAIGPLLVFGTMLALIYALDGPILERYRILTLPNLDWGPANDYYRKMVQILEVTDAPVVNLKASATTMTATRKSSLDFDVMLNHRFDSF